MTARATQVKKKRQTRSVKVFRIKKKRTEYECIPEHESALKLGRLFTPSNQELVCENPKPFFFQTHLSYFFLLFYFFILFVASLATFLTRE